MVGVWCCDGGRGLDRRLLLFILGPSIQLFFLACASVILPIFIKELLEIL